MRNAVSSGAIVLLVSAMSACSTADSAEPSLDTVRSMTERYSDVNVALAEGYVPDVACVYAGMSGLDPALGAMGVHYMRMDLLDIEEQEPRVTGIGRHTDFLQPAILLYEPQADGSMELVAIENVVFEIAWDSVGYSEPPSYQGVPYDYMADDSTTEADEAHMFAPHYERHIWLYRENPNGMFAEFNPSVTCEHFRAPAAPQM
jgi:hypothetical protein